MLVIQNPTSSVLHFEIFYNCKKKLRSMADSLMDTDNTDYQKKHDEIAKHLLYLQHLKDHDLETVPEKFEFLVLANSLFESKIKFKIKHEINNPLIDYSGEIFTLIIRSKPRNPSLTDANLTVPEDLGSFVAGCFSYNSLAPISYLLSDFALVNNYFELTKESKPYDLENNIVSKFYDARNEPIHTLNNVEKISDKNYKYIKKNIEQICNDISDMVSNALNCRRCTIDDYPHSKKEDIKKEQLEWLDECVGDIFDEKKYYVQKGTDKRVYYAEFWFAYHKISEEKEVYTYNAIRQKLKNDSLVIKNKIRMSGGTE
jgi:hypothetical protein